MFSLFRDIQFGARTLARAPGVSIAILVTLALAIAANTAMFTVVNALLLRPFPYRDPAQLVTIQTRDSNKEFGTSLARYEIVRDQNRFFESVAVWTNDNLNLTGAGVPVQVPVARVSPSFFRVLGVQPQLGRAFTEEEGRPEGRQVVMLSDALWRSRYHADPDIVGKVIVLDATAETVVGVLPPHVQFPFVGPADIWTPRYFELSLIPAARLRLGVGYLSMLARLRPGTTISGADADLAVLNQHYRTQHPTAPDSNAEMVMSASRLRDLVVGDLGGKLGMLSAAVALVLLIACANVASLLLARALGRLKEIAMRAALGASRTTILRQLFTESVLLSLSAGVFGTILGWEAVRAFSVWGSDQLPTGVPLVVDWRGLAFALLVSVLAGLLFGTIPALQSARVDLNTTLRNEGGGASQGRSRITSTSILVVLEVALSLFLLVAAGLFLRSFVRLLNVETGFEAHNVLTMNLSLSTTKYSKPQQQIAFFDDVLRRIRTVPGVRSVAISAAPPLSYVRITPVLPQGQPEVPLGQRPFVDIEAISPQWFQTMHVPLRLGRTFTSSDQAQSAPVIIVNETFARQYWPGEDAVGKHVVIGRRAEPAEVVGVAADVKNRGLEQNTQPQIYLPFPQLPWSDMYLLARTDVRPLAIVSAVRAQIAKIDPDQPAVHVQTVDDLIDNAQAQPRLLLLLIGAFAAIALLLAAVGVYGMLSYEVAQRRQEFGIRLALGADRSELLRLVLRRAFALTIVGIILGLAAAFALTSLFRALLYQVTAHDLITFVAAPAVFLCIAFLASYVPARRATRADPMDSIR